MFERTRDYPTAMTDPDGDADQAMRDAVTWFVEQCQAIPGSPYCWSTAAATSRTTRCWPAWLRRSRPKPPRTLLGSGWTRGPVFIAWPSADTLASIADDRRTKALIVLSWTARDVDAWAAAAQPKMLTAGASDPAPVALVDPVVEQGLITLTHYVNHANNLAGALDKRDAIAVLLTLHDGRHRLEPEPIYAWALANGWPARGAQRLRELAEKIAGGTRPRLQGGSPFRPDILQQWRDAVAGSSS